nr:reverse transcriptase domain-containing protein [Tanacetum cinerariifolium]
MSSDNAQSAVTYTSISSDSDGPSWGIPLMNVDELSEMDPYEEVAQQGQVPPLSPMYVPDPIELGEHVPVYVMEPKHPEYHAPSYDDIQVEDQPYADDASLTTELRGYIADSDSIGEDDNKDLKEDPSEEHKPEDDDEDPEENPNKEHEPEDKDTKEEEPSEGSDETKPFEEDETAVTLPPPRHRGPCYNQAPLGHRTAMIRRRDDIPEEDMPPRKRFVFTAPSPGCDVAKSSAAAARAPRGQYDFVDTVEAGQGLIHSPGHDTWTIARVTDRAEDVGYVRALQASEHRMMTSIKEVNLRISYQAQVRWKESKYFYTQLHDAQTDRRDIRLEIDVVRGQRTTYETELQEVRQAYLSFEDQNRALQGTNDAMTPESIQAMIDLEIQRNSTYTQDDVSQSSGGGLKRPVQPVQVCFYIDFMKYQPLNFKGTEGIVGLSQWLENMELVFHISGCAIDNQVKFATCTLLGAALTLWNGHVRTLGRDDAYVMTWGTLKKNLMDKYCPKEEIKKLEIKLWNLSVKENDVAAYTQRFQELALMCTKFLADETEKVDKHTLLALVKRGLIHETYLSAPSAITITPGNVHPSVETTRGMFLLNNRFALILFDTSADRSFVSTAFSALLNIALTALDNRYDVKLADGKIIGANTILRCCTLDFLNHPFNIDLMPVPLGSFDVIIGMDWLREYHAVIFCDEKIVRVPFENETLIFQGKRNDQVHESRLNIISCVKAQKYLSKGCDVFLAHVTMKEAKDKSGGSDLRTCQLSETFLKYFLKTCWAFHLLDKLNSKLIWKEQSRPLRVRALVMTMGLNLPKKILKARAEALKLENLSAEDVGGMIRKDLPKEKFVLTEPYV